MMQIHPSVIVQHGDRSYRVRLNKDWAVRSFKCVACKQEISSVIIYYTPASVIEESSGLAYEGPDKAHIEAIARGNYPPRDVLDEIRGGDFCINCSPNSRGIKPQE